MRGERGHEEAETLFVTGRGILWLQPIRYELPYYEHDASIEKYYSRYFPASLQGLQAQSDAVRKPSPTQAVPRQTRVAGSRLEWQCEHKFFCGRICRFLCLILFGHLAVLLTCPSERQPMQAP